MTGRLLLCFIMSAIFFQALAMTSGSFDADASVPRKIVYYAQKELAKGVREIPYGSNNGPAISRYRASTVGSYAGAPWCAYFVSYIARRAGAPLYYGGTGHGAVASLASWARATGKWRSSPKRGDLIVWGGSGHIGIVETVRVGYITTIEGNTSHAVLRRIRTASSAIGFIRVGRDTKKPYNPIMAPPVPEGYEDIDVEIDDTNYGDEPIDTHDPATNDDIADNDFNDADFDDSDNSEDWDNWDDAQSDTHDKGGSDSFKDGRGNCGRGKGRFQKKHHKSKHDKMKSCKNRWND